MKKILGHILSTSLLLATVFPVWEASATDLETQNPVITSEEVTETSGENTPSQHKIKENSSMEQSYLTVLQRYLDKYGESSGFGTGVSCSFLLDLDGNGTEEMVLGYSTQANPSVFQLEVWEFLSGEAVLTFQHSETQYMELSPWYETNWRDVGKLYPYNGGWILYFAGGGGSESSYSSYDKVYSYQNHSYQLIESDKMTRRGSGDYFYYSGTVNGSSHVGETRSGALVTTAMPAWYSEFKRIQDTYFGGTAVDLFHMDESKVEFPVQSVKPRLSDAVTNSSAPTGEPEVVIPVESNAKTMQAQAFQGVIDGIVEKYGRSNGGTKGLAQVLFLDFTGDGVEELFVYYVTSVGSENIYGMNREFAHYVSEIWQIQGDVAVQIHNIPAEFSTVMAGGGTTALQNLVYLEDRWVISSLTASYQEFSYHTGWVTAYDNGAFVRKHSMEYHSGYEGEIITINGQTASESAYNQAEQEYYLKNAIEIYFWDDNSSFRWKIQDRSALLNNILLAPVGSDHYYGYPVLFDTALREEISSAMSLSGEILALYEVGDGFYYLILDVDGVQEGRLVEKTENNWGLTLTATENISYSAIEEAKTAQLSGETAPDHSLSPQQVEQNQDSAPNYGFVVMIVVGMGIFASGLVMMLKGKK